MARDTGVPIRFVEIQHRSDGDLVRGDTGAVGLSWEELLRTRFHTHESRVNKDGPAFIPAAFKPRAEWVRSHLTRVSAINKGNACRSGLRLLAFHRADVRPQTRKALRALLDHHGDDFVPTVARAFESAYALPELAGYVDPDTNAAITAVPVADALGVRRPDVRSALEQTIRSFERPNYRIDENVEAITMVSLDIDQPGVVEEARRLFAPFNHVIYSTHTYSIKNPYKFRILLNLDQPIAASAWRRAFHCFETSLGVDGQCKNESRLYYYPSIAPGAGVEPVIEINEGRPLSYDDIAELGRRNGFDPAVDEIPHARGQARAERAAPPPDASRVILDYAGSKRPLSARLRLLDPQTYDGFVHRHRESIAQLRQDDSRHGFAQTVAYREIRRLGEYVDLDRTVQFIVRAAAENSSRGLVDARGRELGNTLSELPELLQSALGKNGLDPIERLKDIEDAVDSAVQAAIDDAWVFDQRPEEPFRTSEEIFSDLGREYDYATMCSRHADILARFERDPPPERLANLISDLLRAERERTAPRVDVYPIAEFVFRHTLDFLYRATPDEMRRRGLEPALELIEFRLQEAVGQSSGSSKASARFQKHWARAVARARSNAREGQQWEYTGGAEHSPQAGPGRSTAAASAPSSP